MGVSGNSVAGKSYQIFTVSEELLAKVTEAVQAGEKEARSSKNIQSFEVFCHGFRANISLGRIMIVPPAVCSDRENFPTALLHGALVKVFGTGGEEISDLIEKKIGDSEFDELHKRGILMYGHAGCGKTSIIRLLCDDIVHKRG